MPKDPSIRRRRNKSSTRATLRAPDPKQVQVPELPQGDWHDLTLAWWNRIWHSPMAAEWDLDGDLDQLFILASLIDEFWENPGSRLAGEIRQSRQAFGLTPLDRRRLEWTIEKAEEAKAEGRRRAPAQPQPKSRGRKVDPRQALRVVK